MTINKIHISVEICLYLQVFDKQRFIYVVTKNLSLNILRIEKITNGRMLKKKKLNINTKAQKVKTQSCPHLPFFLSDSAIELFVDPSKLAYRKTLSI